METVLKAIADWIKGILTAGIMSNLSGLFDDVNTQVGKDVYKRQPPAPFGVGVSALFHLFPVTILTMVHITFDIAFFTLTVCLLLGWQKMCIRDRTQPIILRW